MKQDRYNREVKAIVMSAPPTKFNIFLDSLNNPVEMELALTSRSKEGEKFMIGDKIYQLIHKIKVKSYEYNVVITLLE
ncbi:hypothetical protein FG079_18115 [Vibrio cholerae]|nr:hypothetical protein [Vibrio cholerae]